MATSKRSFVGPSAFFHLFQPVVRHPWIAARLAALQWDKWFFSALHPRASTGRAGHIRQVGVRITDRCNLRCETCGQWGPAGFMRGSDSRARLAEEVTPARYRELWSDLVARGERPLVYLWGGEPMLYPGCLEVIESAAALRLPISIATNGSRVAASAARLARAPLFLLQISIDGPCAELHNRIRPAAGGGDNFAAVTEALAQVRAERDRQRGLPLLASLTTISRHNATRLVDIYEAFRERVDVMVFYLGWWIDAPSLAEHERDFEARFGFAPRTPRGWLGSWQPADSQALADELRRLSAAARKGRTPVILLPNIREANQLHAYYADHRERFGYDECVAIYEAMEINSNGDVSPCRDYHDYVVGNVKEATLTEWWNHPRFQDFRRSLRKEGLMPVCSRCCGLLGY